MPVPTIFYYSVINFIIFVATLVLVLRKPAQQFFATRAALLRQSIEDARAAEVTAQQRANAIQQSLQNIAKEVAALHARFLEEGARERAEIVQRANSFAEKMKNDSDLMIAQEVRRMKKALRATAVDVAIVMAERILREHITPDDQGRLAKHYISRLGATH